MTNSKCVLHKYTGGVVAEIFNQYENYGLNVYPDKIILVDMSDTLEPCSHYVITKRIEHVFHDWRHPTHNELLMLQLQYGFEPSDILEAIEHVTQP